MYVSTDKEVNLYAAHADKKSQSAIVSTKQPDRQWRSSSFQYLDIMSTCLKHILEGEYNGAS